ncbi:hypothetical protein GGR53DRAFT_497272 [Hypoxylon sp. FL1150]|nr:hypothetical protein GGR53DRAFT_497272 [Hypoxylon sp. FL1150]
MDPPSTTSTTKDSTLPFKKRRAHHKSRRGCRECKLRHVKCDEQRPVCLQCATLDRPCSYAHVMPDCSVTDCSVIQGGTVSTESPPETQWGPKPVFPFSPQLHAVQQTPPHVYSLGDLALLHHVETDLFRPPFTHLVADENQTDAIIRLIVQSALSTPFLMDEVLAFAALHLSVLESNAIRRDLFREQAVQLQTRALMLFNTTDTDITEQNCTARFLFSSFLGLHMLRDTVNYHKDPLELLEKFVQFFSLYRGVGLFTSRGWHIIRNSEFSSIISVIEAVQKLSTPCEGSCSGLLSLLERTKQQLGPSSYEACYDAVQVLQWIFNQHAALPSPINRHIVMAWPVRISLEFLDLLKRREPEALAIMAHWAVLLHYGRDFWVFDNEGRYLVEAISTILGPSWDEWLEWPRHVVLSH